MKTFTKIYDKAELITHLTSTIKDGYYEVNSEGPDLTVSHVDDEVLTDLHFRKIAANLLIEWGCFTGTEDENEAMIDKLVASLDKIV